MHVRTSRRRSLFHRLTICLGMLLLGTGGASAQNLVANPGFETIDEKTSFVTGWGKHYIYTGEWNVVSDPAQSHGGMAFVTVAQTGPQASEIFTTIGSGRITPTGDRKYKLSVWVKGKGQFGAMTYIYGSTAFLHPDNSAVSPNEFSDVNTEKWEQRTFDVTIPATAVHDESKQEAKVDQFEVLFNVKKGPIAIDDVQLVAAGSDAPPPVAATPVTDDMRSPLTTFTPMPAPKLDGTVEKEEWSQATGFTGFFNQGAVQQSDRQTFVQAGFDEKNLYVAFESTQDALALKEVTPGPNASFSNDVEGFEVWIKPPGKGYFQVIVMPGGATIFKSEDLEAKSWGSDAKFASRVENSAETQGGILTMGKKIWTGEIAIPFSDLQVAPPAEGETWRVNFCRDFSVAQGAARLAPDWTTWSPLKAYFTEVNAFGYGQFSRKAQPFKITGFGDLKAGRMKIEGTSAAPVGLQAVAVLNQFPDKAAIDRSVTQPAGGAFKIEEEIKTSATGTAQMTLKFSATDLASGLVVSKSRIPFEIRPSFWLEPILLYSAKKVEVAVNASRLLQLPAEARLRLTVEKAGEAPAATITQALDPKHLNLVTTLDVDTSTAGTYMVKGEVLNAKGDVVASTAESLVIPTKPEWYDNTIGITDEIPAPFTPIELDGRKARVILREYTLQDNGLPSHVLAKGKDMLTGPITVRAVIDGKPVQWTFKPLEKISQKGGEVIWRVDGSSAKLGLAGTLKLDFDGFALWDVKFTPKGSVKIEALSLDVPVAKEHALFAKGDGSAVASLMQDRFTSAPGREDTVMLGNKKTEWGSWTYSRKGWIWGEQFYNEIYVGSDERGFSLMTETDRNVYGKKYAEFLAGGDEKTTLMRINLISEPTTISGDLPYTYFYQTTPVRPEPKDPRKWHITFDPGSVYNSSLPGYNTPEAKAFLAACWVGQAYYDLMPDGYPKFLHSREESVYGLKKFQDMGIKVPHNLWYAGVADSLPEYKIFGQEWTAIPNYSWPTQNSTVQSACLNSSYQQFMIRNTEKIVNDLGYDGVYTDATAVPCSNARHNCGYDGRDGKRHRDLNLLSTRSFVKRMYAVLKSDGKDRVNFSHSGESTSTAGFVDVRTHGEELCQEEFDHYKRLSPDYFRAKYAQNEYGVPYTFYAVFNYKWRAIGDRVPMSEILMMCLSHRIMPALAYDLELMPVWKTFDPWWTSAQFIPYWKPNAPATTNDPVNVLSSTFLKREEKQALIVVANWQYKDATAKVSLNTAELGFTPKSVELLDVEAGTAKSLNLSDIKVDLKSRNYQVLLVK